MSTRVFKRGASWAVIATALIACDRTPTAPGGAPSALVSASHTGVVTLEWQRQARVLVAANRLNALAAGRVYAALGVAQDRAIEVADAQVQPEGNTEGKGFGPGGRSRFEARRGAVAGASARVLGWFFPAAAAALDQKIAEQGRAGSANVHPKFTRGVAMGRNAAGAVIEHVQNDGFTTPWTGTVPVGPGMWIPTSLPPAGGTLGSVKPYFLTSGSQFRPARPPEYGSALFETDLDEVLTLTQIITPEQIAFARYWDFSAGTPTPLGFWNATAAEYVAQHKLDERGATQVFALMHAAMFDALIACWEAKYHYWTLRPSQADPGVSLALGLPNFPSYPSGHSCTSAAAARVLTHFFPDRATELATYVSDAGLSRILAGIHYRFDITAGYHLGNAVANWAIAHATP